MSSDYFQWSRSINIYDPLTWVTLVCRWTDRFFVEPFARNRIFPLPFLIRNPCKKYSITFPIAQLEYSAVGILWKRILRNICLIFRFGFEGGNEFSRFFFSYFVHDFLLHPIKAYDWDLSIKKCNATIVLRGNGNNFLLLFLLHNCWLFLSLRPFVCRQ